MKAKKKLGIWMDYSVAYLMEFTSSAFEIKTIVTKFFEQKKLQTISKSYSLMLNKEQKKRSSYYKKISEIIKDYKKIILFGCTNAKEELFGILSEDERFIKIKIEIQNTDKMTKEQKNSFVIDVFFKKKELQKP